MRPPWSAGGGLFELVDFFFLLGFFVTNDERLKITRGLEVLVCCGIYMIVFNLGAGVKEVYSGFFYKAIESFMKLCF